MCVIGWKRREREHFISAPLKGRKGNPIVPVLQRYLIRQTHESKLSEEEAFCKSSSAARINAKWPRMEGCPFGFCGS